MKYITLTIVLILLSSPLLHAEPNPSPEYRDNFSQTEQQIAMPSCAQLPVETGQAKHISKLNIITLKDGRQLTITNVTISPLIKPEMISTLLSGSKITIAATGRTKDRHNRLMGQIMVNNEDLVNNEPIWLQEYLLKKGYATAYSLPHNKLCVKELLAIEASARAASVGEWGQGKSFKVLSSNDLKSFRQLKQGSFQIVEGKLLKVARTGKNTYLNFTKNWRTDFTAIIHSNLLKRKDSQWPDLKALVGKKIRVRGWLDFWNGPMIRLETPEMLEVIE